MKKTMTLLIGLALVVVTAGCRRPLMRESTPATSCTNNLHLIDVACVLYRMDRQLYPTNLLSLTPYITNRMVFICPSSGEKPGPIKDVDSWSDYVLVTNMSHSFPFGGEDPGHVLAYCKPENHKKEGGVNVLFVGDDIRWVPTMDFGALSCDVVAHSRCNNQPQPTSSGDRLKAPPEK
jgi:hypothetical protein